MSAILWIETLTNFAWAEPDFDVPADEEQQKAEQRQFAQWAAKAVVGYDLRQAASPDTPLTLRREPVLKWSNPERGRIFGHVFIWTAGGRPEAVASLYKWYHPHTHSSHEFQSLSLGNLTAKQDGADAWATSRPGVEFQLAADAPPPGKTAPERLRQMRRIADHFRADEINREGEHIPLRLLTQPLYRYEEPKGDLLDGALFTFVQGTDPEVLLLVEARRDHNGKASWQYALARLNGIKMRAFYDDRKVWEATELAREVIHDRSQPYFTVQFPQ